MQTANKVNFTEDLVSSLAAASSKAGSLIWDAKQPGLALRLGASSKTWTVVYRPAGAGRTRAPQKVTLGRYPGVSVAAARRAAKVKLGEIANGRDPAAERREAKRRSKAVVSEALNDYEAAMKARGVVNVVVVMATLRRGLKRYLARDLAELDLREFLAPVEAAEAAGKMGAASYLRARLRTFLGWAHMTGRVKANPLAGVRRERATRAQRIERGARGRALSDDDLCNVWRAAAPETVFGRYVRALALTGARRVELARLSWDMVQADRLVIPPTHTKQGREHVIPASPALLAIIDACRRVRTSSPLVFASIKTGGEMKGWTKLVCGLRKASGVIFTLHDLRRTMRSGLTRMGVPADLAEVCIGHQRDELLEIYDRADRWAERVDAFDRWSAHVERVAALPADIEEQAA